MINLEELAREEEEEDGDKYIEEVFSSNHCHFFYSLKDVASHD